MIVGRGIPCRVVVFAAHCACFGQLRSIERFVTVETAETVETVDS